MTEVLEPSGLTVEQSRRFARDMATVVGGAGHDAVERVIALFEYLDELYGGDGFDRLLAHQHRAVVADLVQQLRSDADDQPATLEQGREAAAELAAQDGWEGEIGRLLQGLYRYLDELYGGPGAFTELLGSGDRARVADLVESLTVT